MPTQASSLARRASATDSRLAGAPVRADAAAAASAVSFCREASPSTLASRAASTRDASSALSSTLTRSSAGQGMSRSASGPGRPAAAALSPQSSTNGRGRKQLPLCRRALGGHGREAGGGRAERLGPGPSRRGRRRGRRKPAPGRARRRPPHTAPCARPPGRRLSPGDPWPGPANRAAGSSGARSTSAPTPSLARSSARCPSAVASSTARFSRELRIFLTCSTLEAMSRSSASIPVNLSSTVMAPQAARDRRKAPFGDLQRVERSPFGCARVVEARRQ